MVTQKLKDTLEIAELDVQKIKIEMFYDLRIMI
jgi:hypothetical protein